MLCLSCGSQSVFPVTFTLVTSAGLGPGRGASDALLGGRGVDTVSTSAGGLRSPMQGGEPPEAVGVVDQKTTAGVKAAEASGSVLAFLLRC